LEPEGELQGHHGADRIEREHDHVHRHPAASATGLLEDSGQCAERTSNHPSWRIHSPTASVLDPLPAVDHEPVLALYCCGVWNEHAGRVNELGEHLPFVVWVPEEA
jgi:hypothetical protein